MKLSEDLAHVGFDTQAHSEIIEYLYCTVCNLMVSTQYNLHECVKYRCPVNLIHSTLSFYVISLFLLVLYQFQD